MKTGKKYKNSLFIHEAGQRVWGIKLKIQIWGLIKAKVLSGLQAGEDSDSKSWPDVP